MLLVVHVRIEHDHPPETTRGDPEVEFVEVANIERARREEA